MNGSVPPPDPDLSGSVRVLVVSTSPQIWGAERSFLGLAPLLTARGITLTLASPPGQFAEAWSNLGLRHVDLAAPGHLGLRTAADGRPGARALMKEVATTAGSARRLAQLARDADAVHSNSLWTHLDCAVAGRIARRPVVLELHDLVRPGLGRRVLKAAMRLAACTVAISRAVAETVGSSNRRLRVIPQAVDAERFHPGAADHSWRSRLSDRPDEPIVGVVGRVDPEKGIKTVVQAMAMLAGEAARSQLAVVGAPALDDGSYDRALRAEALALLGDRARFVGQVEDVSVVLRSLDVLVNASASEPFGLSVLEAQASGVPVIGTDAGGIPEFVTDGKTGLLVAPGRPDELAAVLSRVLETPTLRHDLAVAARENVVAHHTLEARATALAGVYRAVVGPRGGRRAVR
jgi:glycosyltransferase involved in cell wall biosynthesis